MLSSSAPLARHDAPHCERLSPQSWHDCQLEFMEGGDLSSQMASTTLTTTAGNVRNQKVTNSGMAADSRSRSGGPILMGRQCAVPTLGGVVPCVHVQADIDVIAGALAEHAGALTMPWSAMLRTPVNAVRPQTGLRTNRRTGPLTGPREPVHGPERAGGHRASPIGGRHPRNRLGIHRGQVSAGGLTMAEVEYGS